MNCKAKQHSDQMVCTCGNAWDMNDPHPPQCKKPTRPTKDQWFMEIAEVTAKRATCPRRQVGAVIVDGRGYVLSTGFNGVPSGFPHCTDTPCPGASCPSGSGLDSCLALHAEANAVARLKEPFEAETIYVTTAPCISCTKLILATSVKRVVFKADYPSSGKALWEQAGRVWEQIA